MSSPFNVHPYRVIDTRDGSTHAAYKTKKAAQTSVLYMETKWGDDFYRVEGPGITEVKKKHHKKRRRKKSSHRSKRR